jgi:thiol-disulfide isomerase/thioredoxin
MSRVSRIVLTAALAAALALGLSGCPGQPATDGGTTGQNGIAVGRITGIDAGATQPPQAGELAPDFYFENPEGENTSLSQLQGTPVLVNFWATWCGPCRYEMPFLQQIHQDWPVGELVLLAVNVGESSSQVGQFMESAGFSFNVLLDQQTAVAQRYNVLGIPTTFFIDKEGVIQEIQVGAFQSQAEIETILDQLD